MLPFDVMSPAERKLRIAVAAACGILFWIAYRMVAEWHGLSGGAISVAGIFLCLIAILMAAAILLDDRSLASIATLILAAGTIVFLFFQPPDFDGFASFTPTPPREPMPLLVAVLLGAVGIVTRRRWGHLIALSIAIAGVAWFGVTFLTKVGVWEHFWNNAQARNHHRETVMFLASALGLVGVVGCSSASGQDQSSRRARGRPTASCSSSRCSR